MCNVSAALKHHLYSVLISSIWWTAARSTTCQLSALLSAALRSLCLLLLTSRRQVFLHVFPLRTHSILSLVCNDRHFRSPASTCSTTRMDTSTAQWPSPPPTCPLRTASPCGSLETSSSGSTTPSMIAPTTASALPQLPRRHQCDLS